MTTFLVSFGLSNAREIFESSHLLRSTQDKFFSNFARLPLRALYVEPGFELGTTKCQAVCELRTGDGACGLER